MFTNCSIDSIINNNIFLILHNNNLIEYNPYNSYRVTKK